MIMDRRALLLGAGAAAFGMPVGLSGAAPPREAFDPDSPADNLRGFVKTMGDLSGKPVWMIGSGRIYGLREGELPLPLFGVEGLRYVKFAPEGEAFRMFVRDWAYFTDLETGVAMDRYANPYTGEDNTPTPLLTRFASWVMGLNGQEIEGFTGKAWLQNRPLRMPWAFSGKDTYLTLELLVEYGHGGSGGEWINMMTRTADLLNAEVSNAPMRYAWTGYSPWARWMEMGDRPGRTLWNSTGRKVADLSSLPDRVRDNFNDFFPGSLDNPETYQRTSGLTTTADDA